MTLDAPDPSPPANPPAAPARRPLRWRFRWTVLLLLCYVLSIGPMFWKWHLAVHANRPSWVELFYRPLVYACEIPAIRFVVNQYINWWIA